MSRSLLFTHRRPPQLDRRDRGTVDHTAKQTEQRDRRRKSMTVTYGEHFDLLVEVHDICKPLAERVAAEPKPLIFRADIADLADAVHELALVLAGLLSTADAQRRTAHLKPRERNQAVRMLRDLAELPEALVLSDAEMASGTWVTALCEHVGPHAGRLSDLLSRAAAPGTRRGLPSVSETLVEALRVVDRAALALGRHLDKAAFDRQALRRNGARPRKTDQRAELAALGIDLEGITP